MLRCSLILSNLMMERVSLHSALQLLVAANVHRSLIVFALMMDAIRSSETSVLIRGTRHNIQEGGILHSRRRGNLKSYN
jgi:hypothetical protein